MIDSLLDSITNGLCSIIDSLPSVTIFHVPAEVYSGVDSIFSFVGWLMPYNLYYPLFAFIISLTVFRIFYAIYIHFKTH